MATALEFCHDHFNVLNSKKLRMLDQLGGEFNFRAPPQQERRQRQQEGEKWMHVKRCRTLIPSLHRPLLFFVLPSPASARSSEAQQYC